MKIFLAIFLTFILAKEMESQVVIGKIIDEKGTGLSSIGLQLYINPNIYSTTTSNDGRFVFSNTTGVEDKQLPTGYAVSNNFPNPFNPTTRIGITLPIRENVKIEVFNMLGQDVAKLIEQTLNAGTNFIDLELNGLPNGFYNARITIDNKYTVVKKMMLVYGSQHLATSGGISNAQIYRSDNNYNTNLETNLDSLVATSQIVGRKTFMSLPSVTGDTLDLGNLTIERYCPGTPTVDYAGKTYNTVQIGSQCWLRENLDVGTMIQGVDTAKNNGIIEKYCYNNDLANCATYGGLYQWYEAMQYSTTPGVQGICPTGWHIPTLAEFQTLSTTVSGDGNALKAIGQGTGGGAGTNTSGFSALLSGYRYSNGTFYYLGNYTNFRSSTEVNTYYAYCMHLANNDSYIYYNNNYKDYGYSVRCVKD